MDNKHVKINMFQNISKIQPKRSAHCGFTKNEMEDPLIVLM